MNNSVHSPPSAAQAGNTFNNPDPEFQAATPNRNCDQVLRPGWQSTSDQRILHAQSWESGKVAIVGVQSSSQSQRVGSDQGVRQQTSTQLQVVVYTYASSTPIWWNGLSERLKKTSNLSVFQVSSAGLAALAERTMKLHCMIQDGQIWLSAGDDEALQLELTRLE